MTVFFNCTPSVFAGTLVMAVLLAGTAPAHAIVSCTPEEREDVGQRRCLSQSLDASRVIVAAESHVHSSLRDAYSMLDVEAIPPAAEIRLPAGEAILAARNLRQGSAGKIIVWIDAMVNGRVAHSLMVAVRVHAERQVAYALHDLQAGQAIRSSDLGWRKEIVAYPLAPQSSTLPPLASVAPGTRLRVSLNQGETLQSHDLLPADAVIAGDQLNLRVVEGPVTLDLPVIAQQEARQGERLLVKRVSRIDATDANGPAMLARVVDRHLARALEQQR
ncbi:flagella basal body P-ring formation protein FlgA [Noviherbaspirillum galbum]|uniref:Flagella basal body P-ring formation protein FlgA n=1 Tax=Noviherbaspirillum galbum TaxID=2709383 RepID=A0A6B3SYH0_9BURK|nr:flagella basal body P-ring formation protein FlgA [Noviherbaspirillum galbum]NEX63019.1 flagella basal body P-ring formation protein FlgA [Noviherbaspirillum galbum]